MTTPFGRQGQDLINRLTIIQVYCALVLKRLSPGEPCREEVEEICRGTQCARVVIATPTAPSG
jgi:hypothetical protein